MNTTITLEQLAEKLNGKVWIKGDMKRIYLNDAGYNTKKMSTKAFVYEKQDGTYGVSCKIECPSQDPAWIYSQEQEVINSIQSQLDSILNDLGVSEVIAENAEKFHQEKQATLAAEEQVQGYFMQWREVRVAINRFGKLATRKRMFVVTYKGAKSTAHSRLIQCNDAEFEMALNAQAKEIAYEFGCEPTFIAA